MIYLGLIYIDCLVKIPRRHSVDSFPWNMLHPIRSFHICLSQPQTIAIPSTLIIAKRRTAYLHYWNHNNLTMVKIAITVVSKKKTFQQTCFYTALLKPPNLAQQLRKIAQKQRVCIPVKNSLDWSGALLTTTWLNFCAFNLSVSTECLSRVFISFCPSEVFPSQHRSFTWKFSDRVPNVLQPRILQSSICVKSINI